VAQADGGDGLPRSYQGWIGLAGTVAAFVLTAVAMALMGRDRPPDLGDDDDDWPPDPDVRVTGWQLK